jgi:soluble lytic murein transglycosylase-like protein
MRTAGCLCLMLAFLCLTMSACDAMTGLTTSSQPTDYRSLATQDALQAGISAQYFVAQINEESGFNPNVVSSAGAIGIAQIMPRTAQSWQVNPWDPVASLNVAAQHMAWYQSHYGDYARALACYNAGCATLLWAEQHCLDYYWCLPAQTERYIVAITGQRP